MLAYVSPHSPVVGALPSGRGVPAIAADESCTAGLAGVLLVAGFEAARCAALAANAMGAGISGAGPGVFAWFEEADQAHAAVAPVRAAFAAAGFDSDAWVSPLDAAGARLC